MKKSIFIALLSLLFLDGCKDKNSCTTTVDATVLSGVDQTKLQSDIEAIDLYLSTNGIVAEHEPNGVRYVVTEIGTGPTPCFENHMTVNYEGTLMKTGTVFNSYTTGAYFKLDDLITGWKLVMPLIHAGSKVTLYIPSGYGYGSSVSGGGTIPANSNLIFEIELTAVR
jgi:FKBP-type peptidyl-prolyl cis-trans isomerase